MNSLKFDLCNSLAETPEKFECLENLTRWLVSFFKNYSFRDQVHDEFADRCLPVLDRIRKQLVSIVKKIRYQCAERLMR